MYISKQIMFKDAKETSGQSIRDFHKVANKYSFDIDIKYGSIEVDGKSMLGIATIPENIPVEMIVLTNNYSELEIESIFERWLV